MHEGSIVVLDFGGQYAHLIARRVRERGVFSEILPAETSVKELHGCAGVILSGGPQSVYDENSPKGDPLIFECGVPILGICYGLQWMACVLGGDVRAGEKKEYGKTECRMSNVECRIMKGLPEKFIVWMSHGDEVNKMPDGFECIASSDSCKHAAIANIEKNLFGFQFHPEVTHTENGQQMIKNFVDLCDTCVWSIQNYTEEISEHITEEAKDKNVFMLVSGGVDSSVAFVLLNNVLGVNRVQGLLIDTGLMRKNEIADVHNAFKKLRIENVYVVDASDEFFTALKNVYDPEEKRKIIGETFLNVQRQAYADLGLDFIKSSTSNFRSPTWLLGQGTIYPDTIETGGTKHSSHIKTHHNRVEAVQKLIDAGLVIEPLKDLYKDEVRQLGEALGLPREFVWRHPFPGPGLGVRMLCVQTSDVRHQMLDIQLHVPHAMLPVQSVGVQGDGRTYRHAVVLFSDVKYPAENHWTLATEIPNRHPAINRVLFCLSHSQPFKCVLVPGYITRKRAELLRKADKIVDEEIKMSGLYEKIWQFPVVLLPIGIHGGESIVLRPVASKEAMTAHAFQLSEEVTIRLTQRIMALDGVDLVLYDLTSKPPATIEWE